MRSTRHALLIFGAGALLGLVVVSANLSGLARVASLAMAAGIVLLPVALVADWRRRLVRPKARKKAARQPGARRRPQKKRRLASSPPGKR